MRWGIMECTYGGKRKKRKKEDASAKGVVEGQKTMKAEGGRQGRRDGTARRRTWRRPYLACLCSIAPSPLTPALTLWWPHRQS